MDDFEAAVRRADRIFELLALEPHQLMELAATTSAEADEAEAKGDPYLARALRRAARALERRAERRIDEI